VRSKLYLISSCLLLAIFLAAGCSRPGINIQAGNSNGCPYSDRIHQVFGSQGDHAVVIAMRESRCQPTAYNRSGASGLFQLLGHEDLVRAVCINGDVFNAECNIQAAKLLYNSSGWAPWGG
jgi:hypothetical protein